MQANLTNAIFIINEIKHALVELKNEGKTRTINLSNFPLSYDEAKFLDEFLGHGSVKIIYESKGLTVWQETKFPGVWWGEYRNSSGKIILRTIEITRFPELAMSQLEDIEEGISDLEKAMSEFVS